MKPILTIPYIFLLFCGSCLAQLGIGTTDPNPSAQLEVVSGDKGVLVPRVSLESDTDTTTISGGNVESLLVYNTGKAPGLSVGYHYWSLGKWHRLATTDALRVESADVTSTNGSITGVAPDAALAAMDLEVRVDGTTLEVDAGEGLRLADDGVVTSKIKDGSVTAKKLDRMEATTGQVLKWDGTRWAASEDASLERGHTGDLTYFDGTDWVGLPKGSGGQALVMNDGATAPEWRTDPATEDVETLEGTITASGQVLSDKTWQQMKDTYESVRFVALLRKGADHYLRDVTVRLDHLDDSAVIGVLDGAPGSSFHLRIPSVSTGAISGDTANWDSFLVRVYGVKEQKKLINPFKASVIDDDTFAGATATNVPSAESVKAYVDTNTGNSVSINDRSDEGYIDIGTIRLQWGADFNIGRGIFSLRFPASFADTNYGFSGTSNLFHNSIPLFLSGGDYRTRIIRKLWLVTPAGNRMRVGVYWLAIGKKP